VVYEVRTTGAKYPMSMVSIVVLLCVVQARELNLLKMVCLLLSPVRRFIVQARTVKL
jgi:hypothetical protein